MCFTKANSFGEYLKANVDDVIHWQCGVKQCEVLLFCDLWEAVTLFDRAWYTNNYQVVVITISHCNSNVKPIDFTLIISKFQELQFAARDRISFTMQIGSFVRWRVLTASAHWQLVWKWSLLISARCWNDSILHLIAVHGRRDMYNYKSHIRIWWQQQHDCKSFCFVCCPLSLFVIYFPLMAKTYAFLSLFCLFE